MIKFSKVLILVFLLMSQANANDDIYNKDSLPNNNSVVNSSSANDIYLIESINAKYTGKNPNSAKINATAIARREAFVALLIKLKLPIAKADYINDDEISDMVRSEQIIDEKIAGNSYSAVFSIRFAKDFVENLLSKKALEATKNKTADEIKNIGKFLIFPVKMLNKKPFLWESENDWRIIFERVVSKNKVQNDYIVGASSVENLVAINSQNIRKIEFNQLDQIVNENNANGVYLLFYDFDEIENKVLVEVTYLQKIAKKQFRLSFINVERLNYNDLMIRVAEKTLEYIRSNPAFINNSADKNAYEVLIKISALEDWINLKNLIDKNNLVDSMNINSVSKDEVKINVIYTDLKTSIEENFAKFGLNLSKNSQGNYELDLTNGKN